jgi:hypothetical protein
MNSLPVSFAKADQDLLGLRRAFGAGQELKADDESDRGERL